MKLPESFYFLRAGWWLVHVLAVIAVFAAGVLAGHHLAGHAEHAHSSEASHDDHAGHHDHTSSEVLRPLMQQMLVDSTQLQAALAEGDHARAAEHADAIAVACEDGGEESHEALPPRLGPSFLERDRELHANASQLREALREGQRARALALNRELVSSCQSCHDQAPAATEVELRVLDAFADTLASSGASAP